MSSMQKPLPFESENEVGTNVQQYSHSIHPAEEALILVLEMLELVGDDGQTEDSRSPRCELLHSLRRLAAIATEAGTAAKNEDEAPWLLDRESFLRSLRQQANHYVAFELPRIRTALLHLLEQHPLTPATSVVHALVSHFTSFNLPRERSIVEQVIVHLDNFYVAVGGMVGRSKRPPPLIALLSRAINTLRRAELAAHPTVVLSLGLFTPKVKSQQQSKTFAAEDTPLYSLSKEPISPCRRVIQSTAPLEAVLSFMEDSATPISVTTICLVGAEGKTYTCRHVLAMTAAVQLRVPLDLLGSARGYAEAVIMRKFRNLTKQEKGVLVVDDVHQMTGVQLECLSFAIERVKTHATHSCLLILTCPEESVLQHRIELDRIFHLGLPGSEQRNQILSAVWGDPVPSDLIEATTGKSHAELQHLCRQALLDQSDGTLYSFRRRLAMATPASLKKGLVEDSLDWQVWGADELEANDPGPLQGHSFSVAWKSIQTNLLMPLTRSEELAAVLGIPRGQSMSLGALITGCSGSGKTTVARQCASFAKCPLLTVSCPALLRQTVGGSEKTLCRLLLAARQASPCILLLEHLEAIASVRGNDTTVEGTMDRLLSTLLVELDGLDDKSRGTVAVIGTTVSADWIDPSLLRPGRLQLVVNLERDWE